VSKQSLKRNKFYSDEDTLRIFVYTIEEYLKFAKCFSELDDAENNPDHKYILLQTKLLLIRKYEIINEPIYLRNVLDAVSATWPELTDSIDTLHKRIDEIESSKMEILLSDGTKRSLHESIEDVMYGMYLHAEKAKIEQLIKTNMTTYLFAVDRYVSYWESLLTDTYNLIEERISDKYTHDDFERASVIFAGDDSEQGQDIHSVPFWSNLRGRDAKPEEVQALFEQMSEEERGIAALAQLFILELQKDDYSVDFLKKMIYPVVKQYWGDFSNAHKMLSGIEFGYSSKVRFDDSGNNAHVLLFKNFNPEGLFIINQPHYSEDIVPLYLKRDDECSDWKIVSIGDPPDTLIKSITIDPNKIIKKLFGRKKNDNSTYR